MKRIFIYLALILASVTVIAVADSRNKVDSFIEANIDALAETEASSGKKCYNNIKNDPVEEVVFCGTCTTLPGRGTGKSNCYKN